MEDNLKNKLGFWLFFIFILFLIVGGYFLTRYILNDINNPKNSSKEVGNIKIDKDKDFIYYTNESVISEDAELYYKDVVINIESQKVLNDSLNKENEIYKNNIQYISKQEHNISFAINYNYDDLYALTFRDYKVYNSSHYVSLVVEDYNYSCIDNVTFNKSKAYVFDTNTGNLITSEELLDKYHISFDSVKDSVSEYLNKKQTKVNGTDVIIVDSTLSSLSEDGLFINEYGKLSISYLVKTTQVDYNEITEVN